MKLHLLNVFGKYNKNDLSILIHFNVSNKNILRYFKVK